MTVRGKVDDWRVQRMIGYQSYCLQTPVGKRVPIESWLQLPYDHEFAKTPEEIQSEYEEMTKSFVNLN